MMDSLENIASCDLDYGQYCKLNDSNDIVNEGL